MHTTPPALLVASTAAAAVDQPTAKSEEELVAEVDECAASEIASLPSAESRRSYETVWRFYRRWLDAQGLRAWKARPKHVQLYIATLGSEGKAKGTISRAKSVLCTAYSAIVRNEYMLSNPARAEQTGRGVRKAGAFVMSEKTYTRDLMGNFEIRVTH